VAVQYQTAQSNFNRRIAAERRVELYEAEFQVGTSTLDLVLRAQASLADAERAYYTSLVSYNKSLADLQFRKGTILDYNNVSLAESDWSPDAYKDALRRAWARSYAFDNNHLLTEPEEFVVPGAVSGTGTSESDPSPTADPALPPAPAAGNVTLPAE
jgi:hypothetical protein